MRIEIKLISKACSISVSSCHDSGPTADRWPKTVSVCTFLSPTKLIKISTQWPAFFIYRQKVEVNRNEQASITERQELIDAVRNGFGTVISEQNVCTMKNISHWKTACWLIFTSLIFEGFSPSQIIWLSRRGFIVARICWFEIHVNPFGQIVVTRREIRRFDPKL